MSDCLQQPSRCKIKAGSGGSRRFSWPLRPVSPGAHAGPPELLLPRSALLQLYLLLLAPPLGLLELLSYLPGALLPLCHAGLHSLTLQLEVIDLRCKGTSHTVNCSSKVDAVKGCMTAAVVTAAAAPSQLMVHLYILCKMDVV